MTDLTEQWKNKKLELHKSYYCQNKKGDVCIATLMNDNTLYSQELGGNLNFEYWEVLAPVPSFQEWQASETSIAYNELAKENEELKEILERHKKATAKAQIRSCDFEIINTQLKKLLKEWVQFETEENPNDFTVISERMSGLANKTKQAIGEKQCHI